MEACKYWLDTVRLIWLLHGGHLFRCGYCFTSVATGLNRKPLLEQHVGSNIERRFKRVASPVAQHLWETQQCCIQQQPVF